MGTILQLTVVANDSSTAEDLAERAVEVARHWEDVLTTWRPDGELARLNARAGSPALVGPDLCAALSRMLALSETTRGAFHPGVGAVVTALRGGAKPYHREIPPLGTLLAVHGNIADLQEHVSLDAGGIGKGIALDAMATMLRQAGASAWFLNFGGSSQLAHGRPEAGDGWIVAVGAAAANRVHGVLWLQDASVSTSRAAPPNDASGAIVDPRSGIPVRPPRLATAVAKDATSADAWSTALIVLGREGLDIARAAGVEALYEDLSGTVATTGFPLSPWPDESVATVPR